MSAKNETARSEKSNDSGPATAVARVESVLARILLVLVVVVGGLAFLEVASWWLLETRSPVEREFPVRHIRKPAPYVMFGGTPDVKGLNSLGYPGPAPAMPKPEAETRVFVLGGSTVFRGEPPIPALLEELAHGAGHSDVRVYNFGVVSSVSGMELVRLVTELVDYQPDVVVFYGGGNDLIHPYDYDPRPGHPFNFMVYEANPTLARDVHDYPRLPLFLYGSHLARFLFSGWFVDQFVPRDELRQQVGHDTDAWRGDIVDAYLGHLEKSRIVAGAFGARSLLAFQPLIYFKAERLAKEEKYFDAEEGVHAERARALLRERIATVSPSPDRHFVDLSDLFRDRKDAVFTDIIHLRQEARQTVAEALFPHLEPLLESPPAATRDDHASTPAP